MERYATNQSTNQHSITFLLNDIQWKLDRPLAQLFVAANNKDSGEDISQHLVTKEPKQLSDDAWATIFVLEVLSLKFKEEIDEYQLLLNKAHEWLSFQQKTYTEYSLSAKETFDTLYG